MLSKLVVSAQKVIPITSIPMTSSKRQNEEVAEVAEKPKRHPVPMVPIVPIAIGIGTIGIISGSPPKQGILKQVQHDGLKKGHSKSQAPCPNSVNHVFFFINLVTFYKQKGYIALKIW